MKVLVLCTGNSCRSQMLEAYLRAHAQAGVDVYSAGVEAHGLNPRAVATLAADGLDIRHHRSELVGEYLNSGITHVITVCDHAAGLCPIFPGQVEMTHMSFPDPARATGTEAEIMAEFAAVRDAIKAYARAWLAEQGLLRPGV
jgi:arsenate reductase